MTPVKRVEIVLDDADLPTLLESFTKLGISRYTFIEGVGGMGRHGRRGGDPFSGAFENVYVLVACSQDEADRIAAAVRPLVSRMGGLCLVSDAVLMDDQ